MIHVFGDAMSWPLAPSEASNTASSLASSSITAETRIHKEKAKQYCEALQQELRDLGSGGNSLAGLDTATARLDAQRELAEVWKGTAEERARLKIVESLQKSLDERREMLTRSLPNQLRASAGPASRSVDHRHGEADTTRAASEGSFMQGLRALKDDLYLD